MNREAAFVSAFEHLFVLGCRIPNIESMTSASDESLYRALYIYPFHPPCVIDIYTLGDMAEIRFHIQSSGLEWPWFREVIAAYENDIQPPDTLPENIYFRSAQADLAATQFQWFKDHIRSMPFNTFKSDNPKTAPERDGDSLRGRMTTFDVRYTFDTWDEDHRDKEIERYFFSMYQLACSILGNTENRVALMEMQRYFYGLNVDIGKDFIFTLID